MTASFSNTVDLEPVTLTPSNETSCVRAVAIINGSSYPIIDAEAELNAHGFANAATVAVNMSGCPDFSIVLGDAATPTSLNDSPSVYFELWAGLFDTPQYGSLDTTGMIRLFLGIVESYEVAPQEDVVTFTLRSIAADLADTKITRLTLNEPTSTTFLAAQAKASGLQFVSPSPALTKPITIQQILGKELVGGANFYGSIYRKSAADLLIQGATFDDCDVWLEDDTIYYQQARYVNRGTPIALVHGRDFSSIVGTHALRQSKNIRVEVHSFQARTRTATRTRLQIDPSTGAITKTTSSQSVSKSIPLFSTPGTLSSTSGPNGISYSLSTSSGGSSVGTSALGADATSIEKFEVYVKNQDAGTCAKLATAIARQIASLEYRVTFGFAMRKALVGTLRIISQFDISGLPYTNFNDSYFARRITHRISLNEGWRVEIEAVNHTMLQNELS
jgi:hypothetical protein